MQAHEPIFLAESNDRRNSLVKAGKLHWIHWFVLGLSILLTIAAWYFSKEQVNKNVYQRFDREADHVAELVKERMQLYENALWGTVALIDSNNGDINFKQWLKYSQSLRISESYPGINGIGVINNLKQSTLANYLLKQQKVRPDFNIHPAHDEAEYWPITYIEPQTSNQKAVGLDMVFEKNRYSAIKQSRDTGMAQITGPITLVQDAQKKPGFLLYVPFYQGGINPKTLSERRSQIAGATYAPFIMHKLMAGTLAESKRLISIKIKDGGNTLFDDNSTSHTNIDPNPLFRKNISVPMYGRIWDFDLSSNLTFRATSFSSQPYFILAGGISIDILILCLFFLLSKYNKKALHFADQVTQEFQLRSKLLESANNALEESNLELQQFAYIASHDLKAPLRAIDQISSWIEEDTKDILDEKSAQRMKTLRGRVHRLESLLDDLLAYSRAAKIEDLDIEKVHSEDIVKEVVYMSGDTNGFSIQTSSSMPDVHTPKGALTQIFGNLIGNAIKHHDKAQGSIKVSATENAQSWTFSVSDDGPGIPEEFHERAFQLFKTLKPRDEVEGSGMGLSIVRKLVERQGGNISIDSCNGKRGTTIYFEWKKDWVQN
ncbi:MAG: CHASE domain-containing protein [Pseudomonadales bacterium]|nr:CHASE domain-containing protein [Pseudomonadales bacterium]